MSREQGFLAEFLRVERLLAAHLVSATGDVHAAEDLLQAVASILWEKRAEYDVSRPFAAWALGVANLEVLKWRQRAARSREALSEDSMLVSRRAQAASWRKGLGYAAIFLATAGGWAGTLFFAHQYRRLCDEHAAALQAIAGFQTGGSDATQHEEPVLPIAADRVIETRGLVLALPAGDGKSIPVSAGEPIPTGRSLWTCPWGCRRDAFGRRSLDAT